MTATHGAIEARGSLISPRGWVVGGSCSPFVARGSPLVDKS
jgi:hypothetical protein